MTEPYRSHLPRLALEGWSDDWRQGSAQVRARPVRSDSISSRRDLPALADAGGQPDRRAFLAAVTGVGGGALLLAGAGRLALGPHPFSDYRTGAGETATIDLQTGFRSHSRAPAPAPAPWAWSVGRSPSTTATGRRGLGSDATVATRSRDARRRRSCRARDYARSARPKE